MVWILFAAAMVASCILMCNRQVSRTVPINYILLFIFTGGMAYLVSDATS